LLLRQTEIENLGVTAPGDENVRRLDVPLDDSLSVITGMRVSARAGASREELRAIATMAIDGLRKQSK
jgi:hypothetical protein